MRHYIAPTFLSPVSRSSDSASAFLSRLAACTWGRPACLDERVRVRPLALQNDKAVPDTPDGSIAIPEEACLVELHKLHSIGYDTFLQLYSKCGAFPSEGCSQQTYVLQLQHRIHEWQAGLPDYLSFSVPWDAARFGEETPRVRHMKDILYGL